LIDSTVQFIKKTRCQSKQFLVAQEERMEANPEVNDVENTKPYQVKPRAKNTKSYQVKPRAKISNHTR
jgi:hypothetical protein